MAAKLTAIITFLLLFFTFGHASVSFDLPENAASIILPTEKLDSVTETEYASNVPESETKLTGNEIENESRLPEKEIKVEAEAEMKAETVPLTAISFRPMKRRFPQPLLGQRIHKCRRQLRRGQIKPWWINSRRFPYGNDMISAGNGKREGLRFDLVSGGGEVRTVPPMGSRFHQRGARFPFQHDLHAKKIIRKPRRNHNRVNKEHGVPRHRHHDHRRDRDLDHVRVGGEENKRGEREQKRDDRHEQNHKHEGGFMGKIWKLLDLF